MGNGNISYEIMGAHLNLEENNKSLEISVDKGFIESMLCDCRCVVNTHTEARK